MVVATHGLTLLFGNRFIEIEQNARHGRPRRELNGGRSRRQGACLRFVEPGQTPNIEPSRGEAQFLVLEQRQQLRRFRLYRLPRQSAAKRVDQSFLIGVVGLDESLECQCAGAFPQKAIR